jgi:multidrug efflux pump
VFVPISFLPGDVGRLFREFGLTLAAAVLFSALVALTLTPMLASKLPPPTSRSQHAGFAPVVEHSSPPVREFLRATACGSPESAVPWLIVGSVLAALIARSVALTFRAVPSEFTPRRTSAALFISMEGPEGASFEYTDGIWRSARGDRGARYRLESGDVQRVTAARARWWRLRRRHGRRSTTRA